MIDIRRLAGTHPLRWEDDDDDSGSPSLWVGPFRAGYVHWGHFSEAWISAWRSTSSMRWEELKNYPTQAQAMAAIQAAVLKALAE